MTVDRPADSVSAASTMPPVAELPKIHDAAQQARHLRQVLQDDKQRIGFFLGAGCPLGVYDATEEKSVLLIPGVVDLTKRVATGMLESPVASSRFKQQWDAVFDECTSPDGREPTVEDVLTELRALANRRGNATILEMTKKDLSDLDEQICTLITKEVNKSLPAYRNAYTRFASWIGGVQRDWPAEVFTPNYDLLFEQALEQQRLPHFDGFVGSREPWFDLSSIEHDVIPRRWTRLWKLHGSINWEKKDDIVDATTVTRIVRVTGAAAEGKVMIYPSHLKYDQSRRMPYLAMLDRLRAFFHGQDAPRLIICGYSFLDDHLNEILLDGLRGNRNAQCFALMYSDLASHSRVVDYASKQGNLTVLATDGAVVGTRAGRYRPVTIDSEEHSPWLIGEVGTSGDPKNDGTRSRLGDFHYFGVFLEGICRGDARDAHATT